MQSALDSPELAISASTVPVCSAREANWIIALSVDLDADARRIFQALTVPEYLEAWIDMPDWMAGSRVVASQNARGYRLDYFCGDSRAVSIIGSFLFCHQRKMRLFWRRTCQHSCAQSLVDFRLRGNFGSSILELRHTALDSEDEFLWHRKLWQRSLQKLGSLLRSS